jgi:hypothetical protein
MLQQKRQRQPSPPPSRPPAVPSWATKNAAGFHGNTSAGRIRLIDTALSLLQIYPYRSIPSTTTKQQQFSTPRAADADADVDAPVNDGCSAADVVVDVGIGDDPGTTIELAHAVLLVVDKQPTDSFTTSNNAGAAGAAGAAAVQVPNILVIGTEVDVDRLRHAESVLLQERQHAEDNDDDHNHNIMGRISLRRGTTDFSLPLKNHINNLASPHHLGHNNHHHHPIFHHRQVVVEERPVLVRAMNVLRDYSVPDAITALHRLYQQVAPGGYLVEGSAETNGRVAMAILWHRPPQQWRVQEDNNNDNISDDDDEEEEEEEIFMAAVIFGVDLVALARDPDYCGLAPPEWFNRHNHLPRLYRGFCDAADCSRDQSPAWAIPMRSFLERWQDADASVTAAGGLGNDNNSSQGTTSRMSITERFVRGAVELQVAQEEVATGRVVVDWADQGIVVWFPGETELVLPDEDEWFYYRQRTTQ